VTLATPSTMVAKAAHPHAYAAVATACSHACVAAAAPHSHVSMVAAAAARSRAYMAAVTGRPCLPGDNDRCIIAG
jgi:hypothetical protein